MPKATAKTANTAKVPSPRARAFIAWMEARGTNTSQVAAKSGIRYTTLASFVQGDTQQLLGGREEIIAEAYDCEASEIFGGKPRGKGRVTRAPLIDAVTAGGLQGPQSQIDPAEWPVVEIGGLPPGNYYAMRVEGTSMDRVSPPGSIIFVNRSECEPRPGRRYIIACRGEATYKRYEEDPVRLEPETTDPDKHRAIFPRPGEKWTVVGRVRASLLDDL